MRKIFFLLAFSMLIVGCSNEQLLLPNGYSPADNSNIYKIGNPYQVNGIWYYPQENYSYREVGIASWYGKDFHKGITANGEVYNMNKYSAAHRTLPLPSIVKVTNLDNGKSIIVRVNDRGPFVNNRIIDLSKSAAEKLDFLDSGTAKVRVELLEAESKKLKDDILSNGGKLVNGLPVTEKAEQNIAKEPINLLEKKDTESKKIQQDQYIYSPNSKKTPALESLKKLDKGFYIQAGAFSNSTNATMVKKRLDSFANIVIQEVNKPNAKIYRVRLGPFSSGEEAVNLIDSIKESGYTDLRLILEK